MAPSGGNAGVEIARSAMLRPMSRFTSLAGSLRAPYPTMNSPFPRRWSHLARRLRHWAEGSLGVRSRAKLEDSVVAVVEDALVAHLEPGAARQVGPTTAACRVAQGPFNRKGRAVTGFEHARHGDVEIFPRLHP